MSNIRNIDERKKLIVAMALGFVAIIFLWWTFVGFGGSSKPNANRTAANSPSPAPLRPLPNNAQQAQTVGELRQEDPLKQLGPIILDLGLPSVPEPKRNIFAYYV
ncbi:MAG: hypothetical protein ABJB97_12710, partial [Acidobacteriota bacterium]